MRVPPSEMRVPPSEIRGPPSETRGKPSDTRGPRTTRRDERTGSVTCDGEIAGDGVRLAGDGRPAADERVAAAHGARVRQALEEERGAHVQLATRALEEHLVGGLLDVGRDEVDSVLQPHRQHAVRPVAVSRQRAAAAAAAAVALRRLAALVEAVTMQDAGPGEAAERVVEAKLAEVRLERRLEHVGRELAAEHRRRLHHQLIGVVQLVNTGLDEAWRQTSSDVIRRHQTR